MRIDGVEVRVVDQPIRVVRTTGRGPLAVSGEGSLDGKPILLKLYAEGLTAFGQVRPNRPFTGDSTPTVFAAVCEYFAPALIGEDIFAVERIAEKFDAVLPDNPIARSVVDYALHDAMGKALGVPAYQLLGGLYHEELPLEWSVGMGTTEQMVAESCRAVEEFGIGTVCLKTGGRNSIEQDVANVAAVREAVGPDVGLGIDSNASWDAATAIRALRRMEALDLAYLEQPVARGDLLGLRRVHEFSSVPLLADESIMSLDDAAALVRHEAVDVFVLKTYKMGGIRAAKRTVAVAESAHLLVNVGGTALMSQLEAAANAHLYASTRNTFGAGEFVFGLGVWGPDPIAHAEGFTVRDGKVRVPSGPGLGVEVDEGAVEKLSLAHKVVK